MAPQASAKMAIPPASHKRQDAAGLTQWKIYQTVMTPINFVTFVISLYLVDNRYQAQRARGHHHHQQYQHQQRPDQHYYVSRVLPTWLLRLVSRPQPQLQPYEWVNNNDTKKRPAPGAGERWYYHAQQKQLLRVEAADAFELRNAVLAALCAAAVAAAALAWWLGRWALGFFSVWGSGGLPYVGAVVR